jgi:Rho GTPase-activating protein 1
VYILNAAALPDAKEADFDSLLPYVLARLPEEDELLSGSEYEVIFFAGDSDGSTSSKKNRPGLGWFIQAYHVLSRAMRKRLQRLYIVHERAWVRILTEIFATIVSSKFRRKITHASSMSNLALHYPIEDLLIPPSTYLHDRRISDDIFAPYASGRRAFGVRKPFPTSTTTGKSRFPRVLRETTNFVLLENNIITEGVFRIPPHAKLKEVLKEAYDRGQKFIIWKENGTALPVPKYPHAENTDEIIEELDQRDAYGVAMASALIKAWYADLYQPVFPESCYRDLKRLYGDIDDLPTLDSLKDLISPSSEWSFLPALSREIITRHLLPLLSAVAARQDQNKMTAENLAVCFAPALLHGPDQLADAKMSSVIRRILTVAIDLWSDGLREACRISENQFQQDLRFPEDQGDWEDPLEGGAHAAVTDEKHETQVTGVILQDSNSGDNDPPSQPPPLPPRSTNSQDRSASGKSSNESTMRRKPAPPLMVPPRYSTIVSDSPLDVSESPINYAAVVDGFPPPQTFQGGFPDEKKSDK